MLAGTIHLRPDRDRASAACYRACSLTMLMPTGTNESGEHDQRWSVGAQHGVSVLNLHHGLLRGNGWNKAALEFRLGDAGAPVRVVDEALRRNL
jgi:hypothetical protein